MTSRCPEHLPSTPDGRYFVHGGRLWRCADPRLDDDVYQSGVDSLMDARRAVGTAKRSGDTVAVKKARKEVDNAKRALGERGPTWWGGPDYNRKAPKNTPYAKWWDGLADDERAPGE